MKQKNTVYPELQESELISYIYITTPLKELLDEVSWEAVLGGIGIEQSW